MDTGEGEIGQRSLARMILYIVLGYWSVGQTIYANKIIIGPMGTLWIKRFILGFMFGWVLIPVAIIKCLIFR